ncbi:hypothetical protein [Streptomyces sp. MH60]|uniref:hypothetical protein n=1 Tax=Streptomyces sp. MH60 TaxID=1940758 RepID=UPI000CEE0C96|nr:hypothetical protein [Streptomyces sp. MH60]PPS89577.1 hypothetical protein BZZ08_01724 [Streptomyces sp. MH60]
MTVQFINSRFAHNAVYHRGIPVNESSHYQASGPDDTEPVPACGARLDLANANYTEADEPRSYWPLCRKSRCFGGKEGR